MTLTWDERYDGTRWFSNGDFHVVGAFEDPEQLGSPWLYYVVSDPDWDEANVIGKGHATPEEAMAVAQRLQNALDGDIPQQIVKMLREDMSESAEKNEAAYDRPGIKWAIYLIEINFMKDQ